MRKNWLHWVTTSLAHGLLGLNIGLVACITGFFLFGHHLSAKASHPMLDAANLGLAIPVALSAGILVLGWWRLMRGIESWNTIALLFILAGFFGVPWSILMLISSMAGSGYC